MNELNNVRTTPTNSPIRPVPPAGHFVSPNANRTANQISPFDTVETNHSEGGFNFQGLDSFGNTVKGFVQTEDPVRAANELERAGISVEKIVERRGLRQKNRRPRPIDLATLAEQFGDLMEVGESPAQVCRLLSHAQTNKMLSDALVNASELIINGRSLSEAFAAQRDHKGEPLFPVT